MNKSKLLIGAFTVLLNIGIYAYMEDYNARIYVAGHNGLVGSAVVRRLKALGYTNIITRSHAELDLRDARAVDDFFAQERPTYVFLAAAKVGSIIMNLQSPVDFLYDNLAISLNVINASHRHGVKDLLYIGSACVYPTHCAQPIKEDALLTGPLDPARQSYAISKIAGIELCKAYNMQYGTRYIVCIPNNLYGPNDRFDPLMSTVVPALINKLYDALHNNKSEVTLLGSGMPCRECLYVDDMADAIIFLMQKYDGDSIVNVGTGSDIMIKQLADSIAHKIGYTGNIVYDASKPDGTMRRLLDITILQQLGWVAQVPLSSGLDSTITWYKDQMMLE